MSALENMVKIISFLNGKNLDSINEVVSIIEKEVKAKIDSLESMAEDSGVVIRIDEASTYASKMQEVTGISYINPHYVPEFESYTCRFHALFLLWYKVRDSIPDYYSYLNAEVKGDTVKMSRIDWLGNLGNGIKVIREYQNGKSVYEYNTELRERIESVRWINKYFNLPE